MSRLVATLRAPWPAGWRVLAALVLYAAYLPLSGYGPADFRFDAAEYWELSLKFTRGGGFSLLAFDERLRGYLGPLLLLPARALCHFTGWSMLAGARALGAGWAALLFGLAVPALWARARGRALAGGRWLALLALGFLFWRDYFNFTLSDMPALTLLLLGLAALGRRGAGWAGLAGALLAAAVNIRPIYAAALPGVAALLLAGWSGARGPGARAAGLGALAAGAALVLLPQLLINQRHFGQPSPLVLAQRADATPLYLQQLGWGVAFQRYETRLVPGPDRALVFADPAGQRALAAEPDGRLPSYGAYLRFVARHPLAAAGRYARHLFNGLDVYQPTPYLRQLHPPGQAALRLLNYALLALGLALLGRWLKDWLRPARSQGLVRQPPTSPEAKFAAPAAAAVAASRPARALALPVPTALANWGVLLALLLPCLLAVPTVIECRFLLPLHLLLLTAVAATWQPVADWQALGSPSRRAAALLLLSGWLWGCWQLSEATARHVQPLREMPK